MSIPVVSGSVLSDVIIWVRRIIKSASNQEISDTTIADYLNRFWVYDVPARIQLFELKRQYTFETIKNIFMYQFPFQNYQMIEPPVYADGIPVLYFQDNVQFYNVYPEFVQNQQPIMGNNTSGPYQITTANAGQTPILRAFIDDLDNLLPFVFITAIDNGGVQRYIVDSGGLDSSGNGILIQTDPTFQNNPSGSGPTVPVGTINYITGEANFSFQTPIPGTNPITIQTSPFVPGHPRAMLFFNNTIRLYPVPDRAYKIQMDAFITLAQFLNTSNAVPFSYMSEYLSRGAARKILSDNGDYEQMQFYETLFKEQELQVLRRTDRQKTVCRTPTIFSQPRNNNWYGSYNQF